MILEIVSDILTTGSSIGEISYLTKRPRDTNIICETDVKVGPRYDCHMKALIDDVIFVPDFL